MPPLPEDRESLLRLAAETELAVAEAGDGGDEKTARARAMGLLQLAVTRQKLGELEEAIRLYDLAATASWDLEWSAGREFSAAARIGQAGAAVAAGRSGEGLQIIDDLIAQFGGFPDFKTFPWNRPNGLGLWMTTLESAKEFERLYDASGLALALLPAESPDERELRNQALALRAKSAEELGHTQEAAELYQEAIKQLEGDEPGPERDRQLNHAMLRVPKLLVDLHRDDEASDAISRLERVQGEHPLHQGIRTSARLWKRLVD